MMMGLIGHGGLRGCGAGCKRIQGSRKGMWRAVACSSIGRRRRRSLSGQVGQEPIDTELNLRPLQPEVHCSAVIEPGANVHPSAKIGPFCHVGNGACIGADVRLISHASIMGKTCIGSACVIYPHAVIGGMSQDKKHVDNTYAADSWQLSIGSGTCIREHVTVNGGTSCDGKDGTTAIGDDVLLMATAHVGHDCHVESGVVLSNGVCLAGHVHVGKQSIIGGLCGVHQYVSIGHNVMIGGAAALDADVIPFGLAAGNRARLRGLNLVGLRRLGLGASDILLALRAYRYIFGVPQARRSDTIEFPTMPTLRERAAICAAAIDEEGHDAGEGNAWVISAIAEFIEGGERSRSLCIQ